MLRRIWCLLWYLGHDWETVYGQQDIEEFADGVLLSAKIKSFLFSAHQCSRCNHVVIFDLEPIR